VGVVRGATAGRWAAAVSGTVAIGLLPSAFAALPADGSSRTPRQLVAEARASAGVAHEGYVETTGDLGLPDLPRLGQVASLLGGTSHARVWWQSPTAWRVARVTPTGESDSYDSFGSLHTWDFESRRATTIITASPVRLPRIDDLLPPQAARRIVAGLTRDDRLAALPATRIAGRSADGVRIIPAATNSTVGRVDIYLDSATGLPLSVQLYPRGSTHVALSSRFLDVGFGPTARSVLTAHVPPGVPTSTVVLPDIATAVDVFAPFALPTVLAGYSRSRNLITVGGMATYGEGLARFVVLPLTPELGRSAFNAATDGGGLPLVVTGGSAVQIGTPLLNAVIARGNRERVPLDNRGRSYLIAGTVDADTLTAAVTALFANPPPQR
jgi:hypothetical protein